MIAPAPLLEFAALGLSQLTLKVLTQLGYEHPTPVQQRAIPPGLAGNDVIGCAATGTGKTAAFVLPLAERLAGKSGLVGLVLAPTRELALQLAQYSQRFAAAHRLKVATLIGGVEIRAQVDELHGANVVVATPGRLVDHLRKGTVSLAQIEVLVLDEADRMLDMGFKPQLTRILAKLPRNRQTLLFSATMAGEVADFATSNLQSPIRIEVAPSGTTAERAQQCVFEVPQAEKTPLLLALLSEGPQSTLVFTRTRRRADKLAKALLRAGVRVVQIHADRSQAQRKYALDGFRSKRYQVLVATDVASRGIDVADIGHVVNFDLPHSPEDYVHRIGRTARAEASGRASSFASPDEAAVLKDIERFTRAALIRAEVPRDSAAFLEALAADRARQADPGPRQVTAGQSTRPPGQVPGRHARTHPKKPAARL